MASVKVRVKAHQAVNLHQPVRRGSIRRLSSQTVRMTYHLRGKRPEGAEESLLTASTDPEDSVRININLLNSSER